MELELIDQTAAPFKFMISPIVSGIDTDEGRHLTAGYQNETYKIIKDEVFNSPIVAIVCFPKITDPSIGQFRDRVSHKRKQKAMFVGLNIPFKVWMQASARSKADLFAENLTESVKKIPSKQLLDEDRNRLLSAVDQAHSIMKTRLLN